jgi:hypothetical protein
MAGMLGFSGWRLSVLLQCTGSKLSTSKLDVPWNPERAQETGFDHGERFGVWCTKRKRKEIKGFGNTPCSKFYLNILFSTAA